MPDIALLSSRVDVLEAVERVASDRVARALTPDSKVAILDEGAESPSGDGICKLWLGDDSHPSEDGSLHVAVASFLRDPESYVAAALQLSELRAGLSTLQNELAFSRHIEELMSSPELEMVFEKVTRHALSIVDDAAATLLLHDPVVERFVVAYGNDSTHADTGEFLPGIPVETLQEAMESRDQYAIRESKQGGAIAVIPIQVGCDLIGVMKVSLNERPLRQQRIEAAAHYIRSITPVLFNLYQLSKNKDLALRDDLTKAFNRRFFESHLDEELERARRYNSQLSVIFLDLDDLKIVNNMYGHLTGSRMLQEVAKRILGAVRTIDKVVRFGGDEFCIILPQTDSPQAQLVASRVRRAMTEHSFYIEPGVDVPITASFGIATFPTHAVTKEDLIRAADAAMYGVKSTTKNSIAVATAESSARRTPRMITHAE
jgi:diguanylate cyclase (GGDEF)-like protein